MAVIKESVEHLLGWGVSDTLFAEAVEFAKRKQEFLQHRSPEKLDEYHLTMLTAEYIRQSVLCKETEDLGLKLNDMKKSSRQKQGTPQVNHILSVSAL